MMGIVLPETCWACNKICNKYHLLHLVGILFPHNNDDARSKSLQINIVSCNLEEEKGKNWKKLVQDKSRRGLAVCCTLCNKFQRYWPTQMLYNSVAVLYTKDRRVVFRGPRYVHQFLAGRCHKLYQLSGIYYPGSNLRRGRWQWD